MSWVIYEYLCPSCGQRLESLEQRSTAAVALPHCGTQALRVPSAISGRVKIGEVGRGKSDERPPGVMNTEPLADGMGYKEWRKGRRAGRMDEIRAGLVDRKVYV